MSIHRSPCLVDPLVSFEAIDIDGLNRCLLEWRHKMGALNRPYTQDQHAHGLFHNGICVAVCSTSSLVAARVAGLGRDDAVELSRVCAERQDLCRAVVRLWREFVFPALGRSWAVSYQDAVQHSGNLYRFDGWVPLAESRSGTDTRTGRAGRKKVIWGWCADPDARRAAA